MQNNFGWHKKLSRVGGFGGNRCCEAHRAQNGVHVQTCDLSLWPRAALRVRSTANFVKLPPYTDRFSPTHSLVQQTCTTLIRKLCELPASGEEYTGLHPAWCFVIAAACTSDPTEYQNMDEILQYIANCNKSVSKAL